MNAIQETALSNARGNVSTMNYGTIYAEFVARGISADDIIPRENVLSFHAWKALGRVVKKGEHGVKICTWVPMSKTDDDGNKAGFKAPRTVSVFHISQTELLDATKAQPAPVIAPITAPVAKPEPMQAYYSTEFTPS